MGQALYRKYRSRSLDEIVGQEHVVAALRTALDSGRVSHAYLFTGPRGVGKTSIARILAHAINNLPYTEESSHIDIIEIDAASNRGIDEIRDLREKVYVAPSAGKFKVYIIDEVHMLTTQAFNALLKTLEEPPAHVVFILATTEVHKLPATIISRTQRYTFRPADTEQLVRHLESIAKNEKVAIDQAALRLIAEHGDGSYRDSVSLLDQIISGKKKVSETDVHTLLGIPPAEAITELISHLEAGSLSNIARSVAELQMQGYQPSTIGKELAKQLRSSLIAGAPALGGEQTLALLRRLLDVPTSADPAKFLEIALFESTDAVRIAPAAAATVKAPAAAVKPASAVKTANSSKTGAKKTVSQTAAPASKTDEKPAQPSLSKTPTTGEFTEAVWPDVLAQLKTKYNTLYSIIRMAQVEFEPHKLRLTFSFAFHQKRLNEAKNKTLLAGIITDVSGEDVEIECRFDKDAKPAGTPAAPVQHSAAIDTVSNIFGGGELLES